MFQFFLSRGVTGIAWIGGAIGAAIIVYALLNSQPKTAAVDTPPDAQTVSASTAEDDSKLPDQSQVEPARENAVVKEATVAVEPRSKDVVVALEEIEPAAPAVVEPVVNDPVIEPLTAEDSSAADAPNNVVNSTDEEVLQDDPASTIKTNVKTDIDVETDVNTAANVKAEVATGDVPQKTVIVNEGDVPLLTGDELPTAEDVVPQEDMVVAGVPTDSDEASPAEAASRAVPEVTPEPSDQQPTDQEAVAPSPQSESQQSDLQKADAIAPTFDLVRISDKGSAVFAGRAEPNADVDVMANGVLLGTTTATANGEFVAMLETPETASPQTIELVARAIDGRVARSAEPVIVLGRLSEPDRPKDVSIETAADVAMPVVVRTDGDEVELVQAPRSLATDQVVLDTITYDAESAVVLVGRGQPGLDVMVYANDRLQGQANVAGDGRWRLLISALPAGNYTLRADQIGRNDAVLSRFETPFQRQFPAAETLARLQSDENEIVVQPGNNLWTIARNRYGDGVKYTVIFDANKAQIRDPDLIYPGQVFELPNQQ